MKKILVIIEKGTDGQFSAYTPETKSTVLNGQGNTVDEAIADMKESLQEVISRIRKLKERFLDELQGSVEFEYKYDVQSVFNHFDEINLTTFSRKIGINPSLLRQYKNGLAYASVKQVEKIKNGLQELGQQLSSAQL